MEKVSQKDIEWLLNDSVNQSAGTKPTSSKKKKNLFFRLLMWGGMLLSMLVLPFFLLIRLSVYLNLEHQWNGWLALAAGGGATVVLLLVYFLMVFRKAKNKKRIFRLGGSIASVVVLGFCLYGLMYLSSVNSKSDNIREVYRSLHPILRVAVATTTLADGELVVTDIGRQPDDYTSMGLAVNNTSLHYKQNDGFVHAIDLRTIDRSEWRNKILEYSLSAMGFNTLRHVGTADHLHVSLPFVE